jgi:hypothetical protein
MSNCLLVRRISANSVTRYARWRSRLRFLEATFKLLHVKRKPQSNVIICVLKRRRLVSLTARLVNFLASVCQAISLLHNGLMDAWEHGDGVQSSYYYVT